MSLQGKHIIDTVSDMEQFAGKIYEQFLLSKKEALTLYLTGELGAGKTAFVRGFLRAMGYQGIVKSPTYTLVESYENLPTVVYHFDLYRINDPHSLENMGIRDYFEKDTICLIEWPERARGMLPTPDFQIDIAVLGDKREVTVSTQSD